MRIDPVTNRREWREFIYFPYQLHHQDKQWIPPLIREQKKIFNSRKNSMLNHCDFQLFLLRRGQEVIGRIAAFVDYHTNQHWKEQVGRFGSYECIDDLAAANMLLQTAEDWCRGKKMERLRGPWSFVSQDWGFIVEGFDLPPVVMSSYNPPYYNQQVKNYGMKKAKDMLVYNCNAAAGYDIPPRFLNHTRKIQERYQITVRSIRLNGLIEDARIIVRLTNLSTANNWGFCPIPEKEAEAIAADLKQIVHPEAILIAESAGKPIGYLLALPDVNQLLTDLNGRLSLTGIFKLMTGIKKLNRYRIWALGIVPSFQRKGITVLLFQHLYHLLYPRRPYVEANYVLEDNHLMNNALRQLKFNLVKKYRVYEKEIE